MAQIWSAVFKEHCRVGKTENTDHDGREWSGKAKDGPRLPGGGHRIHCGWNILSGSENTWTKCWRERESFQVKRMGKQGQKGIQGKGTRNMQSHRAANSLG